MARSANFRVDPRLAAILGEGYRSSEQALKELVDNAWDADADEVHISLPELLSGDTISVRDNGSGMTEKEVRGDYLSVATDRRTRKGDFSVRHKRRVKGRKGIGKFAGLMLADQMRVETTARGTTTRLVVSKDDLINASQHQEESDLEKVDLPLETFPASADGCGTVIMLSNFNQRLSLPTPDSLRQLLMLEYGSSPDFRIYVNGEKINIEDISGESFEESTDLPDVGSVHLRVRISDGKKALRQSGIIFRVQGKAIGQRSWHGLESDESIPSKLLKKTYAEVEADGLMDATTADWGAFVDNNRAFERVKEWVEVKLKEHLRLVFRQEMQLAEARLQRQIKERLAQLPEHRRGIAQEALNKILGKFYGEKPERRDAVVGIVLEALERDEYYVVVEKIHEAKHRDVEAFAEALAEFGLLEVSLVAQQAVRRLKVLDGLDDIIGIPETLEKDVHKALENNLWILGPQYGVLASNRTLKSVIEKYTDKEFNGERADKRPDLLLTTNSAQEYLLLEFKRPKHILTRKDELQAVQYRDDLSRYFPNVKIDIQVIGGSVGIDLSPHYRSTGVELVSYIHIISSARCQLNWLVDNLKDL